MTHTNLEAQQLILSFNNLEGFFFFFFGSKRKEKNWQKYTFGPCI
jgi:hypothetical protein